MKEFYTFLLLHLGVVERLTAVAAVALAFGFMLHELLVAPGGSVFVSDSSGAFKTLHNVTHELW